MNAASARRWADGPSPARLSGALRDAARDHGRLLSRLVALSPTAQLLAVLFLGTAGAACVGYLTSINPDAGPPGGAVVLRVAIIVTLIVSGLYAHLSPSRRAMGRLLIAAGLFSCLWLLNGSHAEVPFSVGLLASSLGPGLFCYLMLAFPSGRIRSRLERRFIVTGTGVMALSWTLAVLSHGQPITATPLLRCTPHCPNVFFLGLPEAHDVLAAVVRAAWLLITAGTALLVVRRVVGANAHFRRLLFPMTLVAVASLVLLLGFTIARLDGSPSAKAFGIAYVATSLAIPLAIFLGLALERLSAGDVLARFVAALGTMPAKEVQSAMADTLNDPQLRIFYRQEGSDSYVDSDGVALSRTHTNADRRQTMVESAGRPVAVVDFDTNLSDQEAFIQAAGKSAVMWLDKERLAGELASSKVSLEASRQRLARTADEERRRIQRDLHDGAQQHLIGMHVKLELALEAIDADPARCAALLAEIGKEMSDTAGDLRALSSDLFPPALAEYGLVGALASAARRMHVSVHFESHGVGRHPAAIETAVYFVCLEGLQNISKHGGAGTGASLRLWEAKQWLFLELCDYGAGFTPEAVKTGSGLQNMHDRIASIGGRLRVESSAGHGTVVRAAVPIRRAAPQAAEGSARPTAPAVA